MSSMSSAENSTPVDGLKTDPEKDAKPESDLSDDGSRGIVPGDKPGETTKLEDAGPPDGGTAAWLVVLGAWCCSFSSPGWVNSAYISSSNYHPRPMQNDLTRMFFHQA